MTSDCIASSQDAKTCGRCQTSKPITEFYRIAARDEKNARTEKICKACKVEIKKALRAHNHQDTKKPVLAVNASALEPIEPMAQRKTEVLSIATTDVSPSNNDPRDIRKSGREKKFSHPNYEDWEIQRAIKVFKILREKRDEARAKGLINW